MDSEPAGMHEMTPQWRRLFAMPYAELYPMYVAKVTRKGRTTDELATVIEWLTGYDQAAHQAAIDDGRTVQEFFDGSPAFNPKAELITGSICGYKVQEITEPLVKRARQLDKLVDELAKGKALEKVTRA